MQRRQFLAVAGTLATGATTRVIDHRTTHPQMARMQLALWRALDACEAFADEHADCDCAARAAGKGWHSPEHDAMLVCQNLRETPFLLRLFATVLAGLSRARRPAPGPLPAQPLCGDNDRRQVATILALREVIAAGREAYAACAVADCPVCEQVDGIANHLDSPCSLLEGEARWCLALDGKPLHIAIAEWRQEA